MREYGYVVVVADDQVLREAAVETPPSLGEGLFYLLWGNVFPPPTIPSSPKTKMMISHC
jgi:hypothetical protein